MSGSMIVHDIRLGGVTPNHAPNAYPVGSTTSTAHIFGWMAGYARERRGLDSIDICCHGVWDSGTNRWVGLQLGDTLLEAENIGPLAALLRPLGQALVQTIRLYACFEEMGSNQGRFDLGWNFCQKFANNSGAIVVAGRASQRYNRGVFTGRIDFGHWEGQVVHYHPNNSYYLRPQARN